MVFISKLLILYKINLNRHKKGYFSTINRNIEKQASVMLINSYPRFPPFLLYFRCKPGVTLHGDVSVMFFLSLDTTSPPCEDYVQVDCVLLSRYKV